MNTITNKELYDRCIELSRIIHQTRGIFITLLPEIERRKIYKEHGMHTVYEFAAKLGSIPNETVRKVLCLAKRIENFPELKRSFYTGKVGWTKLYLVTSVANINNEKLLAEKASQLSKSALIVLVKDYKVQENLVMPKENKLVKFRVEISQKTYFKLKKYKKSITSGNKAISWDEALNQLLDLSGEVYNNKRKTKKNVQPKFATRHIPKALKEEVIEKQEGKCSHINCNEPIEELHHQDPFSVSRSHESLAGLCKNHHELVHNSIYDNEVEYKINLDKEMSLIDKKYQAKKMRL